MPHFIFCTLLGGLLFFQSASFAFAQNQFCAVLRLRNAPQFEDLDKLSAMAVGDFNGDGRPDLALSLNDNVRQNYAVLIRLNNNANGFSAPLTFTVEANPLAIAAGDFNGDGRADLVLAHRASGEFLRFYSGQGDGTFNPGAQLALAQPQDIAAITSVDLTGDGRPELIVQSDNFRDENQVITPFVNVLRNDSGGGSVTFSVAARIEGKGAIAADFNRDGRPDLALTRSDALRVLAGRGDATFGAELNQSIPLHEMQHSLTAGDFNGDGRLDVAATTSTNGGQVIVLSGNGAGDFTDRLTVTDVRVIVQLVRALRVPGRTDLVVADESAATYLTNNGGAQFRRDDTALAPGLRDAVVADFNGDGREDFATLAQTVTLLLNNGGGGFNDAPLVTEPRNTFLKIALGDVTGDGRDDLAALEAPNQLTILRGDGAGRFARAQQFTLGENPTDILIADFNRDGRRDVAALSSAGLAIFLGTSAGELSGGTNFNVGGEPFSFTALDYDADGRTDLAVTLNNQSNVSLLRGNGNGTFDAPRAVARPANSREIISADFNGDGRGDLLIAAGNDRAYALTSNGDGGFTERGSYDIGSGARKLALGDFNGDGRADVAIGSTTASSAASDIVVLFSNGNGTFAPTPRVEWGNNHSPLTVADLNSDGRSDLVLSNVRDSLVLLTGDGAGRFPFNFDRDGQAFPRSYFALSGAINDLVGKDLNADGFPDFVLAGRGLTVLFGGCLRTATPLAAVSAASYTTPLASEMIGAAFSSNLATSIARSTTNPLPTNLAGTSGTIFDSAGVLRPLPLFFVSPAQVNFLVPRDVALGNAELRITSSDGAYAVGNVTIANTAPGIFTANGNSRGVAAGFALRVLNSGAQVNENILQFNGSSYVPLPIDLSAESEPVFLVLFGTGWRNRNNAPVTVTIGGTNAEVTFAGAQGTLVGLDQINVRLPRSLIGRGVLNVAVNVGNQPTNTVQIQIK